MIMKIDLLTNHWNVCIYKFSRRQGISPLGVSHALQRQLGVVGGLV